MGAPEDSAGYRLMRRATLGAARLDGLLQHGRRAGTAFVGAVLTSALDLAEMSDLTVALYGLTPSRPGSADLDHWEAEWYAASLPPAPARVLVTAAGTGREVAGLRRLGYSVDAFEPAPGQAALIGADEGDVVLDATYDDLVRAWRGDAASPAAPLIARTYDAVILGWGSYTHVFEPGAQADVLAACDAICPEGPILASFWAAVAAPWQGRAHRVGRRLGTGIARLRGTHDASPDADDAGRIGFAFNVGFTCRFSRDDVTALAGGVGRDVAQFELQPYAHATLTPRG
jgi:hypothetical protein